MRINKFAKAIATCAVASACVLGAVALTGCGSNDSGELTSDTGLTGGVAGSVNGVEIPEDRITRAVNNIRMNYGYTEDDAWKQFLKSSDYTVESMRYTILGGYIDEELVKQCADQLGITVSDEEIDEAVDKVASQYSTQSAWEDAVNEVGYDNGVEGYRESIKYSMLQEKISKIYSDEAQEEMKNNKNVLSAINETISQYDGAKKSSMVLFAADNELQAKVIRKKIADGEISMADAAKEYSIDSSTKDKGGEMGWDTLSTYNDEYTEILDSLEKEGQVSKATETQNGWAIVQLEDVYKAPKKVSKVSDIPEDFATQIKTTETQTRASNKYNDWLDTVQEQQDVVVNPMPDNLPYWVDMSSEYTEEEMKEINDKAYEELVGEVAAEEVEDDTVEDNAKEGEDASGDQAAEGSEGESSDNGDAAAQGSEESGGESSGEADAQADSADSGE